MSEQELTPWFVNGEKPARKGVYQQMCGFGKQVGYQYWSGARWYPWHETAASANKYRGAEKCHSYAHCGEEWRGLAHPPKAKP